MHLNRRSMSIDTQINLIIGSLTIATGVLSVILAWATWRLTDDRRRERHRHQGVQGKILYNILYPHILFPSHIVHLSITHGLTGQDLSEASEPMPRQLQVLERREEERRPYQGYELAQRFRSSV